MEEIKELVDQLTPDERGALCPYWHRDWSEQWEREPATRVCETAGASDRVKGIKSMIDALSPMEQCELNMLVQNWPDDDWDKQMKADAEAGKLDWMIEEARRAEREGTLRDFPEPEEPRVPNFGRCFIDCLTRSSDSRERITLSGSRSPTIFRCTSSTLGMNFGRCVSESITAPRVCFSGTADFSGFGSGLMRNTTSVTPDAGSVTATH